MVNEEQPPLPVNVRVELEDGTEWPVECVYAGLDGDLHVWTVLVPKQHRSVVRRWGLRADVVPPKTQLRVELT